MFWIGFLIGAFAVLAVTAIIFTVMLLICYQGEPILEEPTEEECDIE
jgi:ACR3 family arsenite efflux pump ArsB